MLRRGCLKRGSPSEFPQFSFHPVQIGFYILQTTKAQAQQQAVFIKIFYYGRSTDVSPALKHCRPLCWLTTLPESTRGSVSVISCISCIVQCHVNGFSSALQRSRQAVITLNSEELTVTRHRISVLFLLTAFLLSTASLSAPGATNAAPQHGFSIKEYEKFHDVLHPLEHDALPKKDYRRIRSQANLLVKRGNAIVRVGVPSGTCEDKKEEFAKELDSFKKALVKFRADARTGTNSRLKASYSAVHDKFEMLAGMLPRQS